MTMMVAKPIFIDTNIFVYANVAEAPLHQQALAKLKDLHDSQADLWVSRQVLREFLAVLTRPQGFANPRPLTTVISRVRYIAQNYNIADEDATVTNSLLELLRDYPAGGKQIHDANIVATMQAYGIPELITHNTANFTRFANLISVTPLMAGS